MPIGGTSGGGDFEVDKIIVIDPELTIYRPQIILGVLLINPGPIQIMVIP